MVNIKYVYTPQESIYDVYNYQFNEACLKVSHTLKMSEEEEITSDTYYDIGSLELDKVYNTELPLIKIETIDGELVFNLLYAVPTQEDYEQFETELMDIEFEEFDIPEDAEIIQLEELVFPEPEVDPKEEELHLLKAQVEALSAEAEFKDDLLQQLILDMYS